MFLTVPIIAYNETTEKFSVEKEVDINPFKIVYIEDADEEDIPQKSIRKNCCSVLIEEDYMFIVKMARDKFKELIDTWLKENILTKVYKQIKDDQN